MKIRVRKDKEDKGEFRGLLLSFLLFLAAAAAFGAGSLGFLNRTGQRSQETLRKAITRACIQCYAIEGRYPPSVEYMEENYMYRLTLSSISANVNLSSSYLCRIFKSEVGTSITNYLNNLRIRKAATLIKENTMSMKEISSMVGIDDQLYFSRLFKKCMGISLSEYGKRYHQ